MTLGSMAFVSVAGFSLGFRSVDCIFFSLPENCGSPQLKTLTVNVISIPVCVTKRICFPLKGIKDGFGGLRLGLEEIF